MPISFPAGPSTGQVYVFNGRSWIYNGYAWILQGELGPTGASGTSGTSGTSGSSGTSGVTGPSGVSGTSGTSGSSGTSGVTGATGPSVAGGGGLVLYMNYIEDTSPTLALLSTASISSITGVTVQAPTSNTYSPSTNTDVSQLGLLPILSDPQTTHTFTTPASNTVDALVDQFAIYKTTLGGNIINNILPPGIWETNVYAKADSSNDVDNIGLRFWLLARNTSTLVWSNLVANGSDLGYLYDHVTSQIITLSMYIGNPIDCTNFDAFMVVITSRNRNSSSHTAQVYYQSSNSYSHIHTSFGQMGLSGTSGTSGLNGTSGTSGTSGSSGTRGTSGTSGSSGTSGISGPTFSVYDQNGTFVVAGPTALAFSGSGVSSVVNSSGYVTVTISGGGSSYSYNELQRIAFLSQ
jgi:collagen type VII alpha